MLTCENYGELLKEYEAIRLAVKEAFKSRQEFLRELENKSSPVSITFFNFIDKISDKNSREKEICEFLDVVFPRK